MSDAVIRPADPAAVPRLDHLSEAKRALLARRLAERAAARSASIPRRADPSRAPLSSAQEEVWLLEQLSPGLTAYNLPGTWRVRGILRHDALQAALDAVVQRHEALRTTFGIGLDGAEQRVAAPRPVELDVLDLRSAAAADRERAARQCVHEWAARPFDLASDLMLRAGVVRLSDDESLLSIVTHHLAIDGVSRGLLFGELGRLYAAHADGVAAALPEVPLQYGDYAAWERSENRGRELDARLASCANALTGAPEALDLPLDRPRSSAPAFDAVRPSRTMPAAVWDDVRRFASDHDATPFMVLLAAFSALLGRYAGQDDVVVGVPVAGRGRAELVDAIGFYANTVGIRSDLSGDPGFADLVRRTRSRSLDALEAQDVPFGRVVSALRAAGRPAHAPVFQVMFAFQNHVGASLSLAGVELEPVGVDSVGTKFDLTLLLSERPEGLRATLECRADLFDAETGARVLDHLECLLVAAIAAPEVPMRSLSLMRSAERERVVGEWNATSRAFPAATLAGLLDAQAERSPQSVAVSLDGESVTYAELHRRADAVAARLRDHGAGPGVLVAVSAERSIDLVAALVGVLKAGAAYVPLDPDYPADRLAFMLDDAAPAVLLTQAALAGRFGDFTGPVVLLGSDAGPGAASDATTRPAPTAGPADPAYMIYTSGSTGRPKGALNSHAAIVNRLLWMQDAYGLTGSDVVVQKTPYSFDVSVWEFFWPLITGARLALARPGGHRDPAYLAELMGAEGVTVCHFVPSMLRAFLGSAAIRGRNPLPRLRHMICSGEALTSDLVAGVAAELPGVALHNLYGPTECAVDVSHWTCVEADRTDGALVPIGRPVSNTQLYILDADLAPVPAGIPGELYLGGAQVGLGYHRRPELTAERFVTDPFAGAAGARMYRTGDRARWRRDGVVEYLGRLDDQVKLRGFRIELGEIESALAGHPAVAEAAVTLRSERGGQLTAYVVPDADAAGPLRRLADPRFVAQFADLPTTELPDGRTVFHRNRGETEFLYRELFEGQGYLRHGLMIEDGAVVFDVGANIGLFALFAATRASNVRVFGFEPIPAVHAVLEANAALHGIAGRMLACGLGSADDSVTFTYYPQNTVLSGRFADAAAEGDVVRRYLENDTGAGRLAGASLDEVVATNLRSELVTARIRRLSDVLHEERLDRIDLLKIDVEKAEWDVLQGIDDSDWPRIRQAVIEVHDIDGRLDRVLDLLRSKGFTCAAQEESMLAGTGLYSVHAHRGNSASERAAAPPAWSSADRLRSDIRRHLAGSLPEHMIPAAIVFLPGLPLTSSGKLDRRALPAPDVAAPAVDEPPVGPVEAVIASVWAQALGLERVGRDTSFIDLGGHSLLMTTVLAAIGRLFRIQLPLRTMFDEPTVRLQAEALVTRESAPGQVARVAARIRQLQESATVADAPTSHAGSHV